MSDFFSRFTGKKFSGQSYKANIMSSMNWVIVFLEGLFLQGVIFGQNVYIQVFAGTLMVVLLFYWCAIFTYFALTDPSRLQSEEYNLELHAMNTLYQDPTVGTGQVKLSSLNKPTIQESPLATSSNYDAIKENHHN